MPDSIEPGDIATEPEMKACDVLQFLALCDRLEMSVWLDGGWAVDALLGIHTRRHEDLDIVIERSNVATLIEELRRIGYREVPRDDTAPWNFVLGDEGGHEIDFHVIEFDEAGDGRYGPHQKSDEYTADALRGEGVISGVSVRCITADSQVKFHTGYELKGKDWADVEALCAKFSLAIPDEYARFRNPS